MKLFCVYMAYDEDNNLLYVGRSFRPTSRFEGHKKSSKWFTLVDHIKLIHFHSFEEMAERELALIIEKKPIWNIQNSPDESPMPRPVDAVDFLSLDQMKEFLRNRKSTIVAKATGINRNLISDIKRGKPVNPRRVTMQALSAYLAPRYDGKP